MEKIYVDMKYGNGKSSRGYLLDISRSGAGVASLAKVSEDTVVEMTAKEGELAALKGRVVRVNEKKRVPYRYDLGVKFNSLDESVKKSINELLDRKERRNAPRFP